MTKHDTIVASCTTQARPEGTEAYNPALSAKQTHIVELFKRGMTDIDELVAKTYGGRTYDEQITGLTAHTRMIDKDNLSYTTAESTSSRSYANYHAFVVDTLIHAGLIEE